MPVCEESGGVLTIASSAQGIVGNVSWDLVKVDAATGTVITAESTPPVFALASCDTGLRVFTAADGFAMGDTLIEAEAVQLYAAVEATQIPVIYTPVDSPSREILPLACDGEALTSMPVRGTPTAVNIFDRTYVAPGETPAPRLTGCRFATSGRKIYCEFERYTLMGVMPGDTAWPNPFPCPWVLHAYTIETLGLAESACAWDSGTRFSIGLSEDATVVAGDQIVLLEDTIYATSDLGLSRPASGSVFVEAPDTNPVVRLVGSLETDACSSIALDASATSAGPRPIFHWSSRALCGAAREPCGEATQTGPRFNLAAREFPPNFVELEVEVV
jgi:hypothetical protein